MQSGVRQRKAAPFIMGKPGGFSRGDHVNFADVFVVFRVYHPIAPFF
jgi:hypothetical protein